MPSEHQRQANAETDDRLEAELETLQRWYDELSEYLRDGLEDKTVSQDEFSNAATMATRVLIRLKNLYTRKP
ncbi:MAG: hypothetical protein HKN43_08950 [Rhodothermales bacterium]|nr:hypothetical protein [Rhodothermales bacterium]